MVRNRGEQVTVLGMNSSLRAPESETESQSMWAPATGIRIMPCSTRSCLRGPCLRHGSWDVPIGAFTENSVGVVTGVVRAVDDEAQNVLRSTRSRGNEACMCR